MIIIFIDTNTESLLGHSTCLAHLNHSRRSNAVLHSGALEQNEVYHTLLLFRWRGAVVRGAAQSACASGLPTVPVAPATWVVPAIFPPQSASTTGSTIARKCGVYGQRVHA